ncbi:MAG: UbiA family prenyltransferase [Verrucomicrobiae bacterium]|nr:UbiA family prenyltransferase [Verrucomicrobiae bacterium]
MARRRGPIAGFLELIKFSHTLFAMPFAIAAVALAALEARRGAGAEAGTGFWIAKLGLVLAAMVCARTAAMTFNRLADWDIDQRNPRTAKRHTLATRGAVRAVCVGSAFMFVAVCSFINTLAFALSPVALAVIFFYSLTKRFTPLSHFFLGLSLALAPLGGWCAILGELRSAQPWLLAAAVVFWVAGFDLIYALQDADFDRSEGLHSLSAKLGEKNTLRLARILHGAMIALLLALGHVARLGGVYEAGLVLIAAVLFWEHRLAKRGTPEAVQAAFFRSNVWISVILMLSILIENWKS